MGAQLECPFDDEGGGAAVATKEGSSTVYATVTERFGFSAGKVVQEFGYDDDVDETLREAIVEATGEQLVDEGYGDVTDGVLVWFREGDDDLADLLMDVQSLLDDGGAVVLLTPKAGKPGHVEPRVVEEGSSLAGLHATTTIVVDGWTATHLAEKGRSK
jgi:hypothetical protein